MKFSLILIFVIIIIIILAVLLGLVYKTNKETFINFENFYTISGSGTVSTLTPIPNSNDNYLSFTAGTSSLTLNNSFICDILVIGGGGGGGSRTGGGGGAGALIYKTNYTLSAGTYTIAIGTGGAGGIGNYINQANWLSGAYNGRVGNDTTITNSSSTIIFRAKGGGGGEHIPNINLVGGNNGGRCGGNGTIQPVISNQNIPQDSDVFGNIGGISPSTNNNLLGAGGGGGAGGSGGNPNITTSTQKAGNGGIGKQIDITGTNTYYAGGGGGGVIGTRSVNIPPGDGGLGGGGAGSRTGSGTKAQNGENGKGGGGGGGGFSNNSGHDNSDGGDGGSGIVIIRFKEVLGLTAEQSIATASETTLNLNTELFKYPSSIQTNINGNINSSSVIVNYDNGDTYRIGFTSYRQDYNDNTPINLFNGIVDNTQNIYTSQNSDGIGGSFSGLQTRGYNKTDGSYLGSSIIVNDGSTAIKGEAVYINAPEAFVLRKINFVALNGSEYNAPGKWRVYGSTQREINLQSLPLNIANLTLVDDFTTTGLETTAYKNRYSLYERIPSPGSPTPFSSYIFIFTATAKKTARDIDSSSYRTHFRLNFAEISLFGHSDETIVAT